MVEVREMSQEEIQGRERVEGLARHAEGAFIDCVRPLSRRGIGFTVRRPSRPGFHVTPSENRIDVYDNLDLPDALRLAQDYETMEGKKVWTVKKNYQETPPQ